MGGVMCGVAPGGLIACVPCCCGIPMFSLDEARKKDKPTYRDMSFEGRMQRNLYG
jgi:hypothetical protein